MINTYNIPYTRHAIRGISDLASITATSAGMAQAYTRMVDSDWVALAAPNSDLPIHQFMQSGFQDTFDAATYGGDYDAARQRAYACAVCYTIKMPADALAGTPADITSITANLYGDRWAAAGAIIAAIPSALATPPAWSAVLAATASSPDPVTDEDDVDETWQAPLRKITRTNDQFNEFGLPNDRNCTVTLPVAATATPYLHIILRMGDYLSHYGAWIEGGIMLDGYSLAVTFDRPIILDDPADLISTDLRLPVRAVANAQTVEFLGSNGSLSDPYLRMHWGLRMLVGGRISESATAPHTVAASVTTLTPQLSLIGLNTRMRGSIVECYCARTELSGYNLYLSLSSNALGTSPVRISIIDAIELPDVTLPSVWSGTHANCIGTAVFSGGALGDILTIPITANPASTRLWIIASLIDIADSDTAANILGFSGYLGISVEDAHIAAKPLDVGYIPPAEGLKSFTYPSISGGMLFDLLRNIEILPYQTEDQYAINTNGTASASGTSYGPWMLWGTSDPVSALSGGVPLIQPGTGYFIAYSGNNIYYAGNIDALDQAIVFSPQGINSLAIAADGFIVVNYDNTVSCYGTACKALLNATVGTWTNIDRITTSGNGGGVGTFKLLAQKTDGGLLVHGYDVSATSTLQALTSIDWAVLSNIMTVLHKSDGSVLIYKSTSPSFKDLVPIAQSWTNIQTLAAAAGSAFCVHGSAPPYSVSVLTDTGATSLDWFNPSTLPAGSSPAFIIGSDFRRLALGYFPA